LETSTGHHYLRNYMPKRNLIVKVDSLQDMISEHQVDLKSLLDMFDLLHAADPSYESTAASISQLRARVSALNSDIVTLEAQRSTITTNIEKCKQELTKHMDTARKSTSVHVARAQSEQTAGSEFSQELSKKSKGRKKK